MNIEQVTQLIVFLPTEICTLYVYLDSIKYALVLHSMVIAVFIEWAFFKRYNLPFLISYFTYSPHRAYAFDKFTCFDTVLLPFIQNMRLAFFNSLNSNDKWYFNRIQIHYLFIFINMY